jgi:predicted lipoprotein
MATKLSIVSAALVASAAIGLAACGSVQAPGPGSAASSALPPAATQPASPVAAQAANRVVPKPAVYTFNNSGTWDSPAFRVPDGATVEVTYSYRNNIMAGEDSGDNFMAELDSSGDANSIANAIAVSGGTTTTLSPDTSSGDSNSYHLDVRATGRSAFTVTVIPAS